MSLSDDWPRTIMSMLIIGLMIATLFAVTQNRHVINVLRKTIEHLHYLIHEMGTKMGVVADTLQTVQDNLDEYARETKATLDAALSRDSLDDADKAAIQAVLAKSQELKDLVPNAVTLPLPDPENTTDLNPTADDVLDPSDPVVVSDESSTES